MGRIITCINLSAFLAREGFKVLIVDLDPQGNASSGVAAVKNKGTPSVYSVLSSQMDIDDKGLIQSTKIPGLHILPSTIDLAGAEIELAKVGREQGEILSKKLASAKLVYDYIMIDCPPSLGLLTVNALTASDSVLIPIQCEFFALEGLSQLINTVKIIKRALNPSLEIEGVVLTMYDPRSKLTLQVEEEIRKYFSEKLFEAKIPRNIRLAEAPSFGMPILLYDRRSSGSRAYEALKDEFLWKERKRSKQI